MQTCFTQQEGGDPEYPEYVPKQKGIQRADASGKIIECQRDPSDGRVKCPVGKNGALVDAKAPEVKHVTKVKAKHPPRLPTRIIETPPFPKDPAEPEEEQEEVEEQIRKQEGPAPPKPPEPINEPPGAVARKRKQKEPEELFMMEQWQSTPAHGACDPAAIFSVRESLEQVKANVPAHVCLEEYKDVDNACLDLQTGFDKGLAKCANQSFVSLARQKANKFHACIKEEFRASPHVRPDTKADTAHKLRVSERTVLRDLIWPKKNKSPTQPHPTPQEIREEEQAPDITKEPEHPDDNPGEDLPPQMTIQKKRKKPRPPPPPPIIKRPQELQGTGITAWTEPGAPESLVQAAQAPIAVVPLCPLSHPCAMAAQRRRRRRAEGFLFGVRA